MLAGSCSAAQAQLTLAPVVVSATRFADDADKLAFGVSVITAEDIRQSGASTVNEAVMKLLGVPGRLDLYGGGDYALDLRGFGSAADSNQVVIVDGVRINEADLGGTRLSGIPIDSVERIEVIRGSGTVLYGEGAAGGVIVIATRAGQGLARSNEARTYAAIGSHALLDTRAGATLNAGELSLELAGAARTSDNHRENFHSRKDGASAGLQWRHEGLRLGLRQSYDKLDGGLPGSLSAAQYEADPRQSRTPNDHASIRNRQSGVLVQADLGDWQLAFDAGWRDKALRSVNVYNGSASAYDYDVEASTYALRARYSQAWGALTHALTAGFDANEWTRKAPGDDASRADASSRALYLKDDVSLGSGTRFSVGWRAERIDKTRGAASDVAVDDIQHAWDLGVTQSIGGGASAYGRVGRSFRLPNVDEFGFTAPGVSLRAQTSRDVELGARWADRRTRAELRVYRSALTDEIGYDPTVPGEFFNGANVNFDLTRRQGVELELSQAVSDAFSVRVVAASRQARFESGAYEGKRVALVPRSTLSLQAGWKPAAGHTVDAYLNTISSQHPDFANACSMPRYTTMDLRYAFQRDAIELALGVSNLADRKYYTQAFRCAGGQVSSIYPEDGRALVASLRLTF